MYYHYTKRTEARQRNQTVTTPLVESLGIEPRHIAFQTIVPTSYTSTPCGAIPKGDIVTLPSGSTRVNYTVLSTGVEPVSATVET